MQKLRAITLFKTYRPAHTTIRKAMFCSAWILFLCDVEQSAYDAGAVYVSREWIKPYTGHLWFGAVSAIGELRAACSARLCSIG
ncbi:hypothetical protein EVAR_48334_1 [Eumeta japonica]|uniref:Uncharacterized protein n=1 Tax=Eumeta variegata TaxID=151549 RepID=A0A4C1YLA1_EUMVA|nr:hypothetical protein EVAR_48334_1 [Eumeta japonica]